MDIKGKVILISNRNVNPGKTDVRLFGDDLNPLGELESVTAEPVEPEPTRINGMIDAAEEVPLP